MSSSEFSEDSLFTLKYHPNRDNKKEVGVLGPEFLGLLL